VIVVYFFGPLVYIYSLISIFCLFCQVFSHDFFVYIDFTMSQLQTATDDKLGHKTYRMFNTNLITFLCSFYTHVASLAVFNTMILDSGLICWATVYVLS